MPGRSSRVLAYVVASALAPAAAPLFGQSAATSVEIEMTSFKFAPAAIRLEHGRDYLLHFVNRASGRHNFSAPAFFAAARPAPAEAARLKRGSVDLGGGEDMWIRLTAPGPGRYAVRCTHFMHSTFGMTGEIVIV